MKTDEASVTRVANGYIIRLYNIEHHESAAYQVHVAATIGQAFGIARKAMEE